MKSKGNLEAKLASGEFVITAETTPPDGADEASVMDKVGCLKGLVDAVNVTDGAGARAHMSALACAAIMAKNGIEPVLQFTVRDRNRLAIQGEMIGAPALGIHSILCLHGDSITNGDQPDAKPVEDTDSKGLMSMARQMRDEGTFPAPSGRAIKPAPGLLIGGADSPRDPDADFKPTGLLDKIEAGADFFQTQFAYDIDILKRYMAALRDHGVTEKAKFIVGVGPIMSAKSARWMTANLFGVDVPDHVIARIEGADDEKAEGRKVCAELVEQYREIEGIAGAHLMAPRGEKAIAATLSEYNLRG
ncbi:MAG: 5,10-methylenetetrahydrofolate reductase [Rhodospirillaceae bacterium]|jgi:methylenetetrahydrofolate reductase (NADPH)|nr:5,10-methylenetetrahydrofolate reductase [Rhodospirillaceae bacterium]MBT6509740.1 5,10-methylenetetrahydrofolate reductase [Rhodospirillaceae bacterium]MBT7647477.1 5,10-methylenetetrahydrofolate reductase [Rhodospirillaceae bacterium]